KDVRTGRRRRQRLRRLVGWCWLASVRKGIVGFCHGLPSGARRRRRLGIGCEVRLHLGALVVERGNKLLFLTFFAGTKGGAAHPGAALHPLRRIGAAELLHVGRDIRRLERFAQRGIGLQKVVWVPRQQRLAKVLRHIAFSGGEGRVR